MSNDRKKKESQEGYGAHDHDKPTTEMLQMMIQMEMLFLCEMLTTLGYTSHHSSCKYFISASNKKKGKKTSKA